jgi:hypothetical protein
MNVSKLDVKEISALAFHQMSASQAMKKLP